MSNLKFDVIDSITEEQKKLINKSIANGYPVEIVPSKNGFKIYSVGKKLISWECGSDRT